MAISCDLSPSNTACVCASTNPDNQRMHRARESAVQHHKGTSYTCVALHDDKPGNTHWPVASTVVSIEVSVPALVSSSMWLSISLEFSTADTKPLPSTSTLAGPATTSSCDLTPQTNRPCVSHAHQLAVLVRKHNPKPHLGHFLARFSITAAPYGHYRCCAVYEQSKGSGTCGRCRCSCCSSSTTSTTARRCNSTTIRFSCHALQSTLLLNVVHQRVYSTCVHDNAHETLQLVRRRRLQKANLRSDLLVWTQITNFVTIKSDGKLALFAFVVALLCRRGECNAD